MTIRICKYNTRVILMRRIVTISIVHLVNSDIQTLFWRHHWNESDEFLSCVKTISCDLGNSETHLPMYGRCNRPFLITPSEANCLLRNEWNGTINTRWYHGKSIHTVPHHHGRRSNGSPMTLIKYVLWLQVRCVLLASWYPDTRQAPAQLHENLEWIYRRGSRRSQTEETTISSCMKKKPQEHIEALPE